MVSYLLSGLLAAWASSCAPLVVQGQATHLFVPTNYSVVTGIFVQDEPTFDPTGYNLLNDSFGLIDKSPDRWQNLSTYIEKLNAQADSLTAYKLFYVARHGEGYHNVAEATYGTDAWNCYWSELTTDGNITWGPDPQLTPKGVSQALANNAGWKTQIQDGVPLPQSLYSSPLRRAANTLTLTWSDVLLTHGVVPLIKEGFRESIGLHTCDERSSKGEIATEHPGWTFDPSFAEHDQLWNPIYEETGPQQALRTQMVLNELFASDMSTYISITGHGGTINAFFSVVGHNEFSVATGGFVPVLVKAVGHPEASMPVITGGQSATRPTCTANPTAAASVSQNVTSSITPTPSPLTVQTA